jgi:DNA polymerase-1
MSLDAGHQLALDEVKHKLNPLLANPSIKKQAHNTNLVTTVLSINGFDVHDFSFDTMLAAHLLGDISLELKSLVLGHLGIELLALPVGTGVKQVPAARLDVATVADCASSAAVAIGSLFQHLDEELKKQGLWQLFADVEMPLVPVLVHMQENGVLLDTELLRLMSQRLGDRLTALESEIYKCVGHQFNINSPRQLGSVLFDEMHLATQQKKKGNWSTEASVLESLRGVHPVADFILEYRQLTKLKSTYIDALPQLVNSRTARLHTSFNQMRTATGRLSSSDPNLQNIPVKGELGREIRRAFIAPTGSVLLSGDYSQIDLRALAHLSQDPLLMATFELGADIHTATAVQLFDVESSKVTADMRRLAKTVNFGVIYGMSGYGLEQATEFSRQEAEGFIRAYFEKYPGIKDYLEATKQQAREKGYVETVLGRKRAIPEINSPNRIIREAAERMAINMPVQGTSADIIKVAMLKLDKEMQLRRLKSKLILQVHDELIFEVPETELETMRRIVPQIMSQALTLSVPVRADVKTGYTWGEME